jgi:hypothetical protein
VATILFVAILVVAGIRGIQIGRSLVDRTFKNRAYWGSLLVLYAAFFQAQFSLFNFRPGFAPSYLYAFLYSLDWDFLFILIFVFIDSTIMVTMRMDFFHRNTLRWASIRKALIPLYIVGILIQGTYYNSPNQANFPGWALALVVVMDAIAFGSLALAVPVLLVGARRTPDRTFRRFVTLLGLALLSYFAFNAIPGLISPAASQYGSILSPIFAYLSYMTVMSLSPVGRVEKGAGSTLSSETKSS